MPVIQAQKFHGKSFPIGIIVSRFNSDITSKACEDALTHLKTLGFSEDQITVVEVPGAVELPLAAQVLAKNAKVRAIVCYAAVVRGETGHYDFVCKIAAEGIGRVSLDTGIPVIFGVLTTENKDQALARVDGRRQQIGIEYVDAGIEMVQVLGGIEG